MQPADNSTWGAEVYTLLQEHFGEDLEHGEVLAGGVFSRAFAFRADAREYVVRLNTEVHAAESFAKDDYAWRHFGSLALPIPRIVATGETADGCYAISERVAGRPLSAYSHAERRRVMPVVLDTLEALGTVDTSASQGYGDWDGEGHGRFGSWHDFLAVIIENHPDGYFKDWHRLFDESFLERDVFQTVYDRMMALSVHCPNERSLVHNDYHFNNIIVDAGQVTGVIDWANALYGDPLYDVAWLDRPSLEPGWWYDDGEILRARFGRASDYEARVTCYQLHVGLDHLRYFAFNGRRDDYYHCREWLLERISNNPE